MVTLPADTFRFLSQLKKNNNRKWFETNRSRYLRIREGVLQLTAVLLERMKTFDPSLTHTRPESCLFRIHRDIRFTNDKSPFKTHIGVAISSKGKNFPGAGYYLHLEPGNSFAAGGCWFPDAHQLYQIRQEIDYNYRDFIQILQSPSFRSFFTGLDDDHKLTRPPKGYAADHEAIELLKLKSFTCSAPLPQSLVTSPQLARRVTQVFAAMYPFIQFLNAALLEDDSDKISFS
ncbi:MAG: DUF2461 domain-containing protein [Chitinophagales bacterium]|nr:DUF2461 domain-containing protein [Chitinophagales bacterium]MDW8392748.1 DUF2461 domain-containing protein [Chitinophagales bacterium]